MDPKNFLRRLRNVPAILVFLALANAACFISGSNQDLQATADALGQAISGDQVAESTGDSLPTPTSFTNANENVLDALATSDAVFAAATQQVIDLAEAQQAAATAEVVAATATTQARLPIEAELPIYGVDPARGKVGWIHPPLTLQTEGYLQYTYGGEYITTVARDFVLVADITWNTRFGSTACGFVLRSDGNEEAFNQYIVLATRFTPGHVEFLIMQDGEIRDDEVTDIVPSRFDPLFQWQNDTTNRLAVVANGNTFTIFTNGTQIGQVSPSIDFERGFMAFVALNESGDTTCRYDNAWLWTLS